MLKAELQHLARQLGFDDCRIAPALPAAHRELYAQWVAEGKHGEMAWMARNVERRSDPRLVLTGAQSVIVFAMNYYQGAKPNAALEGCIARYAWNNDYHDIIEKKLRQVDSFLQAHGGVQRCYVDTGPVLERDFANEAGLGWNGKSTMQIHRSLGTWFFLAEVLTTLDIEPDAPVRDLCGKCTRCMDACPTRAITSAHTMDARRCIAYLTIESKGSIPLEFRRAIGGRLYGCDDCLAACPWNRFAQVSQEAAFA
ncbi:MAG: tRNA epoxyqueuosine(34) reductase QueG, partial [Roseimicrobium sp.]